MISDLQIVTMRKGFKIQVLAFRVLRRNEHVCKSPLQKPNKNISYLPYIINSCKAEYKQLESFDSKDTPKQWNRLHQEVGVFFLPPVTGQTCLTVIFHNKYPILKIDWMSLHVSHKNHSSAKRPCFKYMETLEHSVERKTEFSTGIFFQV